MYMNLKLNAIFAILRGLLFRLIYYNNILNYRYLVGGAKFYHSSRLYVKKGCRIEIGKRVSIYQGVSIYMESASSHLSIGNNTFINRRSEIVCMNDIHIGNNCAISWDVKIMDTDYHYINNKSNTKAIYIGDNVWIGMSSLILKGVHVGNGAVIGARSVVTRDVPPYAVVAGNPARVVKEDISWNLHKLDNHL